MTSDKDNDFLIHSQFIRAQMSDPHFQNSSKVIKESEAEGEIKMDLTTFQSGLVEGFKTLTEATIEYSKIDGKNPIEEAHPILRITKALLGIKNGSSDWITKNIPLYAYAGIDEKDITAIYPTVLRLIEEDRNQEAIPALKLLLLLAPHNEDLWHNLGIAQFKENQFSDAFTSFKQALDLMALRNTFEIESYSHSFVFACRALINQQKHQEALQLIGDAIDNPQNKSNKELSEALQEMKSIIEEMR